MPRTARKNSNSNIYHVMLRGINRQNIFEEDGDRLYFMKILESCKEVSEFRLYAFVLMSNHVHFLIEPAGESLDTIFRRIGTRYAGWYNRKYQRAGHLFQDRFRSENVETDQYFMTALRYILQNPLKAGLEDSLGHYRWSSYRAYEKGKGALTDTQFALDLFGGREALMAFLSQNNDDAVMDEADFDRRLRGDQAKEKMVQITQCESAADFRLLDRPRQKELVIKLYHSGLSMGQIAELTGVPKTTVANTVKKMKDQTDMDSDPVLSESDSITYMDDLIIW